MRMRREVGRRRGEDGMMRPQRRQGEDGGEQGWCVWEGEG